MANNLTTLSVIIDYYHCFSLFSGISRWWCWCRWW